ncbi:hypothetical protein APA_4566 [Pseudanabaena sp. lw0831]|nr:hypothetical protein APA_4566 [Pseudanabaena sp. lw0831]
MKHRFVSPPQAGKQTCVRRLLEKRYMSGAALPRYQKIRSKD